MPASDKWIYVKVGVAAGVIRVGLLVLPFKTLRKALASIEQPAPPVPVSERAKFMIMRATEAFGNRIHADGPCLTKALTLRLFYRRRGIEAVLRIGVKKDTDGEFKAHAWVESEGHVVIGGAESPFAFTPLPPLEQEVR